MYYITNYNFVPPTQILLSSYSIIFYDTFIFGVKYTANNQHLQLSGYKKVFWSEEK